MDINNQRLPQIYKRQGKECYLDPIRKKLIYITPEETIRQRTISYLLDQLKVPADMIDVEVHLSHYGIESKRRADILINTVNGKGEFFPIAVIECKAPEIPLDEKAHIQMFDYGDKLGVVYAVATNGNEFWPYIYDDASKQYKRIDFLPTYHEMINGVGVKTDFGEPPERIAFEEIEPFLKETFADLDEGIYNDDISKDTPLPLAKAAFNLMDGLLDYRIKLPVADYGMFRLVEDYGVRMLTYGNSSGGQFYGPYRSFLVDVGGSTEFFSFGFSIYQTTSNPKVRTCLNVAHDDEKEAHHALQLVIDENVENINGLIKFYHHGRIAVGNQGSGSVEGLRQLVTEKYPSIIDGKRFFLGELRYDRLWTLEDPEVIRLIVNLISYAIIRDEYREQVKKKIKAKG